MRYLQIIAIFSLSTLTFSAVAIGPELVYDPTVDADIVQTFSFFANEIADLEKQINDLELELKALPESQYLWDTTTALIDQLGKVMEQAEGLSYAAQNEAAEFTALFPGYTVLNNFNEQYQQMTRSSLDTLNNILQNMKASANDFLNENSRLKMLQGFAESVEGQTQALQTAAQLASEQVSQLQLLRQSIMAQANAQIVYYAQQIQKEASAVADLNAIISHGDMQTTGDLEANPLAKPNYQ